MYDSLNVFPRIVFPDSRLFLRIIVPGFVCVSNNCISRFACVSKNYSKKKVSRLFQRINIPGFTFLGFFTSVKNERFISKSVF